MHWKRFPARPDVLTALVVLVWVAYMWRLYIVLGYTGILRDLIWLITFLWSRYKSKSARP